MSKSKTTTQDEFSDLSSERRMLLDMHADDLEKKLTDALKALRWLTKEEKEVLRKCVRYGHERPIKNHVSAYKRKLADAYRWSEKV